MIEEEIWNPVSCCSNYEVSNLGRVRRCTPGHGTYVGKILVDKYDTKGYRIVALCKDSVVIYRSIHRLVGIAFLQPGRRDQTDIAHNDGNKLNNRADNLRWATRKENNADRERHGTIYRGEQHHSSQINNAIVYAIRSSNKRQVDIARELGISRNIVQQVKSRSRWRHVA